MKWSKEGLYYLLRYGRKNWGCWDDECEPDEILPDEDDASLIAAAPDMLAMLKELEWVPDPEGEFHWCPYCESDKNQGHISVCKLGNLLKKIREGE